MEFSIQANLANMSTESLQKMLDGFLSSQEDIGRDFEIILLIHKELDKRKKTQ